MIKVGDMVRPKTKYESSEEMDNIYREEFLICTPHAFEEYTKLLDRGEWLEVYDVIRRDRLDLQGHAICVILPSESGYAGNLSYYFLTRDMEKYGATQTEII